MAWFRAPSWPTRTPSATDVMRSLDRTRTPRTRVWVPAKASATPAARPPPPTDQHDVRGVRNQLLADGGLAGDDVEVVERMQKAPGMSSAEILRVLGGLGEGLPVADHPRPEPFCPGHFGCRRIHGHHRYRRQAQCPGGPGHPGGVIAGRCGDHGTVVSPLDLCVQGYQGPAHLVGAGFLLALELEAHPQAGGTHERGGAKVRRHHRSCPREPDYRRVSHRSTSEVRPCTTSW